MIQKRGQLTERIKKRSLELFGYEIDQVELRLLAYVQYVMTNEQRTEYNKINLKEWDILSKWRYMGWIVGDVGAGLKITKEFWDMMCELIFLGYVDLD